MQEPVAILMDYDYSHLREALIKIKWLSVGPQNM